MCRGHRAHRLAFCPVSFLLFCKLCSAGCPVTSLGSLQNLQGDKSLLARAILMYIQPGGLGLPSSLKCGSEHSTQSPSRNLMSFLFFLFKPPASAHDGPDTGPGVRSKEKQSAHWYLGAAAPNGCPGRGCACQNHADMPKEVRLLSHGPGLTRSLWDPPPVAFNTLLPDAQEQSLLSALLSLPTFLRAHALA